jgi:hypothetical protein
MTDALWTSDFVLSGRELTVKATGARLRLTRSLAAEAAAWLPLYAAVRARAALRRLTRPGPAIWFGPDRPRPWYLLWKAASWAGLTFADTPEQAACAFYFEDATTGAAPSGALNGGCTDVSKSRVAEVFGQVFGYALAVDPRTTCGPMVEKGEANGVHDGRIVFGPLAPSPGRTYQRVVDNLDGREAVDLRTPIVAGRPVVVFVKRRPAAERFANRNTRASLAKPEEVFSPAEIEKLSAFARAMRLDWGGLDVLRDRTSGLLYVVDVNKTDMGPPSALPFPQKLAAVRRLARALTQLVQEERAR